jgi:N-methylhydantoinase A
VRVRGVLDKPAMAAPDPVAGGASAGLEPVVCQAHFPGVGAVPTPGYRGADLRPGTSLPGPLLVREPTTTVVVPPGWTLSVTSLGNYLLQRGTS